MLAIGDSAPLFTLPNQHGDSVSLDDEAGSFRVVYFYPRADTPGCTAEACGFRDHSDEFARRGVTVYGISDDPVSDLTSFAEKHDLGFDLLSDETGAVARAYDSYGEKQLFGRTVDGTFRNSYIVDPDGQVAAALEGVSPGGHADEILKTLDERGAVE